MKVAILTPTFNHYSGIDRVVELQAEDYRKKGYVVKIYALEAKIQSKIFDIIELGMPKNPFLQRIYRLFFFLDFNKMNYYKQLKDFNIIISHFYPMNWIAHKARKKYNLKYIYHDHGINTTGLINSVSQKIYMRLFRFFNNLTIKNIDEAYSVSKYLQKQLKIESGIESKVIYNKIDTKRFNKYVKGRNINVKYDLGKNKVLLYVGRIAPHKGLHLLIKSYKVVKKTVPNIKLLIVGKPTFNNYYNKLLKIADSDIIFTGFVKDEDLPSYYAACDIYTTASLWEGFDLPAAEAQACGKPVVAFDIGSHPEIIKDGILVRENDVESFSKAVIKLLK